MMKKPIHAKPSLYAYYFFTLKEIAFEYGYNLVLHGSLNRDLDLIAIPWVNDPKDEFDLINALSKHLTGNTFKSTEAFLFSRLPGGRRSYVINLNRGEGMEDPQYYLDISVTPLKTHDSTLATQNS